MAELPKVLAGPIVRRVEPTAVCIWIALSRQPKKLSLQLKGPTGWDDEGTSSRIVRLGANLYVALFWATFVELQPGHIYQYDVLDDEVSLFAGLGLGLTKTIELPSFVLPNPVGSGLRIAQASCRKPHGGGHDALPTLLPELERTADKAAERPQQLYLTGDQIYADDVDVDLLKHLSKQTDKLFGWQERLGPPPNHGSPHMVPRAAVVAGELERWEFLQDIGFKRQSGVAEEKDYYKHHLLGFQEWCAMYLLAWSDTLWTDFTASGPKAEDLARYRGSLKAVRKVLANVATYMIFDDHDVTDDWFMAPHRQRLAGKSLPQRIVRNALLAFALFQDWGNRPADYTDGGEGDALLRAVEAPPGAAPPFLGADEALRDRLACDGSRDAGGGKVWHYHYTGPDFDALVLDSRTWRGDLGGDEALITVKAMVDQLAPLGVVKSDRLLVLVSPAPLAGFWTVEQAQRGKMIKREAIDPLLSENSAEVADAEAWHFNTTALDALIDTLRARRDKIVVLSGDVHYAYTERARRPNRDWEFVQLCSSSSKNSELLTRALGFSDLITASRLNPSNKDLADRHLSDAEVLAVARALEMDDAVVATTLSAFAGLLRERAKKAVEEARKNPAAAVKKYGQKFIDWLDEMWAKLLAEGIEEVFDEMSDEAILSKAFVEAALRTMAPGAALVRTTETVIVVSQRTIDTRLTWPHLTTRTLADKTGGARYLPNPEVRKIYDALEQEDRPFFNLMNFLTVGDTNIGLVTLKRVESTKYLMRHELRWPLPALALPFVKNTTGSQPFALDPKLAADGVPPWATTLHQGLF